MNLSLSVRADLFRAALHFTAKGEEARETPQLAGVRIERCMAGGVIVVGFSRNGLIALRDPDGIASQDETVLLGGSFFDAARRAQREANMDASRARLEIENNLARLDPGATWQSVACSSLIYPNWRAVVPKRAAHARPSPITPAALECLHGAATILSRGLPPAVTGIFLASADEMPMAVASFDAWPIGFALLDTIEEEARAMPWRMPIWMIPEERPEARAS